MVYNFNAGPSHLDKDILERVARSIEDYNNSGLSILEYSHRSEAFEDIIEESKSLLEEFLELKENQAIFFMQGGASFQFYALPFNFLNKEDEAFYIDTGRWSSKAIDEANRLAYVNVLGSSKDKNYNYIPKTGGISSKAKYLHLTSNNTIYGTQYKSIPESKVPIVADMSSDILSRKFDYNKFDMIYAGAQKNLGTAGATVIIVKKDFLEKAKDHLPPMLSYKTMHENNSLYNTPPVLAIYIILETLRWTKKIGGIGAIDKTNKEKAALLYNTIDESKIFKGIANKEDRSMMNVCFTVEDDQLENEFLDFATKNGVIGIKGHRTAGGFRASLYNCIPMDYVKVLSELMKAFEKSVL